MMAATGKYDDMQSLNSKLSLMFLLHGWPIYMPWRKDKVHLYVFLNRPWKKDKVNLIL